MFLISRGKKVQKGVYIVKTVTDMGNVVTKKIVVK